MNLPNNTLPVVGLDPSLSNFGMSKGYINIDTLEVSVTELGLVKTAPSPKKAQIRKNSDDFRRSQELISGATEFIGDIGLIFAEMPVGSQSARSMASYGVCMAVLAALSQNRTMIQVMPLELKMEIGGKKNASKQEIITNIHNLYPNTNWPTKGDGSLIIGKAEHQADSVGAILTGRKTEQFQQLLLTIKQLGKF